jgi:hypothetical protein
MSEFLDNVGKFLNEACCGYYSQSTQQGGASAAAIKALRGMYAVDTPIGDYSSYGTNNTIRGQVAKQAEYTLQQRNYLLSQIDRISGFWISHAIKSCIASDGFNDLTQKTDIFIQYTDPQDQEKTQQFTEDIKKLLKRTSFIDILKDCVMNEGLDYCELFLSTPARNGYGIEYVSDNLSTREHIGIYKNTNLIGAIRFEITPKGAIRGKEFIKANDISHFLLGYKKIPLTISKNFNKKYHIPEKIRCAYPILTPVIDMIIQYDQLQKLQAALEMIKATQPIVMGVGVSAENNISDIIGQLQEWGLTLNENKNNIIGNLDTCDTASIMQSMYNILMIPYSVEEGVNSLRQVAIDFPNSNLPEVLDDLRRSIALALGIPEDYIAMAKGGSKETKDDHISTNPRYSKMLSMVQQSLSKGIVDFIYKHLTTRYTNSEGVLTQTVDKDKIEVLFKSSTNINNKLEEERLMLKMENMSNAVNLIDGIAASPNIPVTVKGDNFLQYWYAELEKNPFLRSIFEKMTPEQMRAQYGPDETPNTGDEAQGAEEGGEQPPQQPPAKKEEAPQQKQEVEQVVKEPQEAGDTKEEEIIRNTFQ